MSEAPPTVPPQTDLGVIDVEALKRWFAIDEQADVILFATRGEMDALFLGLRHIVFSQGNALAAMKALSAGDRAAADRRFEEAVTMNLDALRDITRFTSAMMARAVVSER